MFIALVMACLISDPQYCKILEDQYGPYETREECKRRAMEMSRDVNRHMPFYKPTQYKCKAIPKGRLTAQW